MVCFLASKRITGFSNGTAFTEESKTNPPFLNLLFAFLYRLLHDGEQLWAGVGAESSLAAPHAEGK